MRTNEDVKQGRERTVAGLGAGMSRNKFWGKMSLMLCRIKTELERGRDVRHSERRLRDD